MAACHCMSATSDWNSELISDLEAITLSLRHAALQRQVKHRQDVVVQDQTAALLHEDRQLLQQGDAGLYSLGSTEQGSAMFILWEESMMMMEVIIFLVYRMKGCKKVSYSSWEDSMTRKINDSRTAAIILIWSNINIEERCEILDQPPACWVPVVKKARLLVTKVSSKVIN